MLERESENIIFSILDRKWVITGLLIVPFFFISCTKVIRTTEKALEADGEYDTEFPMGPAGGSLEEIVSSVKLISTIAFYEGFEFALENRVTRDGLADMDIPGLAINTLHFNQPASGTGTVIYRRNRNVALLTCAHIIDFPDTIITYYLDDLGRNTEFIHNISFKIRQRINVIDIHLGGGFEVLAADHKNDIALIGKELEDYTPFDIPVFAYPAGRAADLNWGSFVYVIGYPRGERLITSALVSRPAREKQTGFIIDAVFNRGFSGGIIIAVRDGIPNFELVGMAKSVPATTEVFLAPDKKIKSFDAGLLDTYEGEIRIASHENIFYGITYAVSMETIDQFLNQNSPELQSLGYRPEYFFKK